MNQVEMLERLQNVFDQIFIDKVTVTPELNARQVPEWDSLLHVTLILYIERSFGIRFATGEIEHAKNIGDLMELIAAHLDR